MADIFGYAYNQAHQALVMADQADFANGQNLILWNNAATGWRNQAQLARDCGLSEPARPPRIPKWHIVTGDDGWPVWIGGPDFVGDPLQELPPVPVPTTAVQIGSQIGGTRYYRSVMGDSHPGGTVVVVNGAHYRAISAFGFGLWWERLD